MDDALLVRGIERVDELHDQRRDAARFFDAVDLRDMRIVQRREDLRFTPESGQSIGILRESLRQDFERNLATELRRAHDRPRPCRRHQVPR